MEDVNKECAPGQEINSSKFAHIFHFQRTGINATVWKNGNYFKSDVFTTFAVVDAKAPYLRR